MYSIRPSSVLPETVDLPKCMYHIKPLNGMWDKTRLSSGGKTLKQVKMEPELQAINDRQVEVIGKLQKLKNVVDNLIKNAGDQKVSQSGTTGKGKKAAEGTGSGIGTGNKSFVLDAKAPSEIVIEADPKRPPLSLIFIHNSNPSLRTVSHSHSSCKEEISSKLTSLFTHDASNAISTVRVVWKNLENGSSRLTPIGLGGCLIEGESNVARYLSRVFSQQPGNTVNYDGLSEGELVLVDGVLDLSGHVDTDGEHFMRALQAYIQRPGNGTRTIADYVGYSTLQYLSKKQQGKPLSKPLVDWMNCLTNEAPFVC